jgi:hypothetical protein
MVRMWVFLAIFSALALLLSAYLATRVGPAFSPRAQWAVRAFFALLGAGVIATPVLVRKLPGFSASPVVGFLYFYMGWAAILIVGLLLGDLMRIGFRGERRQFLRRAVPRGAIGLSAALSFEGLHTAWAGPRVEHVTIRKPGLPSGLQGLRIVQISDLHVGNTIRRDYVADVVRKAMALEPDLIALTGDFVDGTPAELAEDIAPLRELRASLGVFYITGNHEYFWDADVWLREFAGMGFIPLHNRHRLLERAGGRLLVAGLPDLSASRFGGEAPDAEAALRGAPARDFTLFLAHQPNSYRLIERVSCDLQLSGHTHAGQFYPIRFIAHFVHRYNRGLYRHRVGDEDRHWVYVNRGSGYWGPPNRLGNPAEITLIELGG